jgi:hypothetical protein
MKTSGTLWGVNWERTGYGIYCYAMSPAVHGQTYLLSRKYVGNGSDPLSVRESVRAFRRDALGLTG